MDFMGGINNIKNTPINDYNNFLKESAALKVDTSSFDNILTQKTNELRTPAKVNGRVEMTDFDEIIAKSLIKGQKNHGQSGNLLQSFSSSITQGLTSVNDKMEAANAAQEAFATGKDVSVHDVMIAAEKASLSFQMAMQLRNKMINAYNEIKDIRV